MEKTCRILTPKIHQIAKRTSLLAPPPRTILFQIFSVPRLQYQGTCSFSGPVSLKESYEIHRYVVAVMRLDDVACCFRSGRERWVYQDFRWPADTLHGSWGRHSNRLHSWVENARLDLAKADGRSVEEVPGDCCRPAFAGRE